DPGQAIGALLAIDSAAAPVGLAHYLLHPHTFSSRMVCYLEDLWVEPVARGGGVGRQLIEALVARGRAQGWRRGYWHSAADNHAGRALYDRVAKLTKYVRYDVTLP